MTTQIFSAAINFIFIFMLIIFPGYFVFQLAAKLIARGIIVIGQTYRYAALFSNYGKHIQAAGDWSFCRQICPVCILVALNLEQREIFGAFWPEMSNHEKVICCFAACRFLDLLFHIDSHHAGCLLQKQR